LILVIDNYDSFTYNLVQFVGELGADPRVFRNDELDVDEIAELAPSGMIVSPGPGRPEDGGVSVDAIRHCSGRFPILGVCLGHQSIGVAFGGRIGRVPPLHGKSSPVKHDDSAIYTGLPSPFLAGRYHSLVVELRGLPDVLDVTARTEDGIVMGMRHREHPTFGVQFHPESILTVRGGTGSVDAKELVGKRLLGNFLHECGEIGS